MEVKHIKCPSCGANLEYNYKKHSYTCSYCGASFIDEKDNNTHNPRVELTPDDLKQVATENKIQDQHSRRIFITIFMVVVTIIFINIIAFFLFATSGFFAFRSMFN